jgi:AmiR/NasT family two-component response regulator
VDAIAAALLHADGTLDAGLDRDWLSSMAVHRAAGMVMEQLGTTIEEALIRLRATAYAEGVPIQQLANDVITGRRRFQEDTE